MLKPMMDLLNGTAQHAIALQLSKALVKSNTPRQLNRDGEGREL